MSTGQGTGPNVSDNTLPTFGAAAPTNYAGGVGADGVILVNSGRVNPQNSALVGKVTGQNYTNLMVPSTVYLSQLQQYFYTPELRPKYDAIVDQMRQAGMPQVQRAAPSLADALDAYNDILMGASYNQDLTPDQYLTIAASKKQFGVLLEPSTTTDRSTDTSRDSTVSLTGKLDAKALLSQWYGNLLGRAPKEYELKDFLAKLNEEESGNPTVVTSTTSGSTTSTTSPDGTSRDSNRDTSSSRTQSGGIGAAGTAQLAEDYVKSQDTYAGTQANTTLMNWFEEAIMGPQKGKVL